MMKLEYFSNALICLSHTNNNINEQCHGKKFSMERLTLLVGSNMDGSKKNNMLVIGKSINPRAMKNIHKESLLVTNEQNKKV
jgi:hypothetical protein